MSRKKVREDPYIGTDKLVALINSSTELEKGLAFAYLAGTRNSRICAEGEKEENQLLNA